MSEDIIFEDLDFRVFLILSRDGAYLHIVHQADPEDRRVQDGLVQPGALICDGCKGGRYRGTCHATKQAELLLTPDVFAPAEMAVAE